MDIVVPLSSQHPGAVLVTQSLPRGLHCRGHPLCNQCRRVPPTKLCIRPAMCRLKGVTSGSHLLIHLMPSDCIGKTLAVGISSRHY